MLVGHYWGWMMWESCVTDFNINYKEKHSYWDHDLKLVIHVAYYGNFNSIPFYLKSAFINRHCHKAILWKYVHLGFKNYMNMKYLLQTTNRFSEES